MRQSAFTSCGHTALIFAAVGKREQSRWNIEVKRLTVLRLIASNAWLHDQ